MFIAATHDYLISPTAKTLGLPGSNPFTLVSPPPIYTSPGKTAYEIPPRPTIPPPTVTSHILHSMPSPSVPEDAKSTISSVFDAPWPQPPPSPASLVPSRNLPRPRSTSPSSSNLDFGYPLYSAITPPRRQSRPFQGSSIQDVPSLPSPPIRRSLPKRPSVKSLKRTLSSEKFGLSGSAPGDVIYMTVVKEVF